jgi:Holliday junction resolvase RusA-like endonuclease
VIRLVIPGEAVPQLRPRFARQGNFVRAYDPEKCRNYKAYIRMLASEAYSGPLLEGQISLQVAIYRLPPRGWGKSKMALALAGQIRPITKPDLTNTIKGIEDALKGIFWHDDAQVVELYLQKWYSDTPRAEVTVDEIPA